MKVLVVHTSAVDKYPPVYSLLLNLLKHNHYVTLISFDAGRIKTEKHKNLRCIDLNNKNTTSFLGRLVNMLEKKRKLNLEFQKYVDQSDLIWTTTDYAIRDLGKKLYNTKHVMQLLELSETIPKFPNQNIFKVKLSDYAQNAYEVVVCEYNRGQIQKAWWNLSKSPTVLPNKPYVLSEGKLTDEEKKKLDKVKNEKRKIILYQGIFESDRNLTEFAKAISGLGDNYCFYIMGSDSKMRKELCEKFPKIEYLGFVSPPSHLEFTKYAYIGLLPYIPSRKAFHYSILNAIYCAPNKIYEYAAYGIPMIGTDVPGLAAPFQKYSMGVCCKSLEKENIVDAINYIEKNYDKMRSGGIDFYKAIDLDKIVEGIIYDE